MKIQILQSELIWEDPKANLLAFERLLATLTPADLILLPEMFTTGFSMQPKIYADRNGDTLSWMKDRAAQHNKALCGSVMVEEEGRFVNRLYFVKPDGSHVQYDKRHLFTMGKEPEHYSAGTERVLVEYKGWKILPLICYDLRFPVFSRNDMDYDALIYVANWPEKRSHHWSKLLEARAIENQAYVAGCNRVGRDGTGIDYSGDSAIIDFKGDRMNDLHQETGVLEAVWSKEALQEARSKFPVLADRDTFSADWK
ncbi:MAG: amidohydrolase [Bacteroidota bacterium]|nr:amidohydrolase [Bacteroidota bacterium]MDX5431896.1 amidohydrolase [Bacteroidota bacterium]MDX5470610.1 amidohydrolase [Bacteroidota bacterium]